MSESKAGRKEKRRGETEGVCVCVRACLTDRQQTIRPDGDSSSFVSSDGSFTFRLRKRLSPPIDATSLSVVPPLGDSSSLKEEGAPLSDGAKDSAARVDKEPLK